MVKKVTCLRTCNHDVIVGVFVGMFKVNNS
jgi:hypothetical protein